METSGGGSIELIPIGMETNLELSSDWATPSCTGRNSPIMREINDNGFTAQWRQPQGTGSMPEYFFDEGTYQYEIYNRNALGVTFFYSVGVYHKTERALKYSLLFIVIPFIAILLFEIFTKKRIHPIQYTLIGITDIIFYALLLSLAEQMHFTLAYCLAAAGVIIVICFYTGSILNNVKRGFILAPILVLLYGYLYSALQSQDYALLIGSVGMFVILTVVMIITRKVDWYTLGRKDSTEEDFLIQESEQNQF
jgi:inner membrane protein